MLKKLSLKSRVRWKVIYEEGKWLIGIYRPEFRNADEIGLLEKHSAPEFFLLLDGEVTLIVSEDGRKIKRVKMKKGEGIVLDNWHNAYSERGDGVALVVERCGVKTKFVKIR